MKKILFIALLFFSVTISAQKIKIKKDKMYADKNFMGSLEKVKEEGTKRNFYFKVKDAKGKHVFNVKKTKFIQSKIYGKLTGYQYYLVECVTENDSIAINDDWFYLKDKKIAEKLIKSGLLTKDGLNESLLKDLLVDVDVHAKPTFVREIEEEEKRLLAFKDYKIERNTKNPIFFTSVRSSGKPVYKNQVVQKYAIRQGVNLKKSKIIGYFNVESYASISGDVNRNYIITNSKGTPVYIKTFRHYVLHPLEEIKTSPATRLELKTFEQERKYFTLKAIELGRL